MVNLFSFFDPSLSFLGMSWVSFFFILLFFYSFLFSVGSVVSLAGSVIFFLYGELCQVIFMKKVLYFFFYSLFFFFLFLNLSSMLPFIFPISSHISVIFPVSLMFWFSPLLVGWVVSFFFMMKCVVPQGTPYVLTPFMVLIELTSILIRPITLSVRLSANITAGHLLLSILVSFVSSLSFSFFYYFVVLLMDILELGVAVIQSYVFFVLTSMYVSEV